MKEPGDEGGVSHKNKAIIRTRQSTVAGSALDTTITFVCLSVVASLKFLVVALGECGLHKVHLREAGYQKTVPGVKRCHELLRNVSPSKFRWPYL